LDQKDSLLVPIDTLTPSAKFDLRKPTSGVGVLCVY
jgi:hypothetical protein